MFTMSTTKTIQKNFRSILYSDYDDPVRVCIECGALLDPYEEDELCEDCQNNINATQNIKKRQ